MWLSDSKIKSLNGTHKTQLFLLDFTASSVCMNIYVEVIE